MQSSHVCNVSFKLCRDLRPLSCAVKRSRVHYIYVLFFFRFRELKYNDTKDNDYIEIYNDTGRLRNIVLRTFVQAGFAKKGKHAYQMYPCPRGWFLNSSYDDNTELECEKCHTGSDILTIHQRFLIKYQLYRHFIAFFNFLFCCCFCLFFFSIEGPSGTI